MTLKRGKRTARTQSFRAKLFRNGGSQAVRLPKECRFEGNEVLIRREGASLVIEPIGLGWSREFLEMFRGPPDVVFGPRRQGPQRDREPM